jgi:hypothetical protein
VEFGLPASQRRWTRSFRAKKSCDIVRRVQSTAQYPGGEFGGWACEQSREIRGGLPTRVLFVSLTGFDTCRAGARHDKPDEQFAQGTSVLEGHAEPRRTTSACMMTFSEFGRRVSRTPGWTDHGTGSADVHVRVERAAGVIGASIDDRFWITEN